MRIQISPLARIIFLIMSLYPDLYFMYLLSQVTLKTTSINSNDTKPYKGKNSNISIWLERWFLSSKTKYIGTLYLIFALFSGLLGTAFFVLIRLELSGPGVQYIVDNQLYYYIITAHAIIIIFFMVMIIAGLRPAVNAVNILLTSFEWCINNTPKPHAFVSLPLESNIFKSWWVKVFSVYTILYIVLAIWLYEGKFLLGQITNAQDLMVIYYIGGCCLGLFVINTIHFLKSGNNLKTEAVSLYLVKYVLITVSIYLLREHYFIYFTNAVLLLEKYSACFPKAVSSDIMDLVKSIYFIDLVTFTTFLTALPYLFFNDLYVHQPDVGNMKGKAWVLMADKSQDYNTGFSSGTNNNPGGSNSQANNNSGSSSTQPANTSQVSNITQVITAPGTNIPVIKDGPPAGKIRSIVPSGGPSKEFCATYVPQEIIPLLGPDSPSRQWAVDKQNQLMDNKFLSEFNRSAANQATRLEQKMADTGLIRNGFTEADKNDFIERVNNLETNVIQRWWMYEEANRLGLSVRNRYRWHANQMEILIRAKRFRDNLP